MACKLTAQQQATQAHVLRIEPTCKIVQETGALVFIVDDDTALRLCGANHPTAPGVIQLRFKEIVYSFILAEKNVRGWTRNASFDQPGIASENEGTERAKANIMAEFSEPKTTDLDQLDFGGTFLAIFGI